jgi:micrococcal nuclease
MDMKLFLSFLIIIFSIAIFGLTPVTIEITDDSTLLYFQEFLNIYEKEDPMEFDDAEIYSIAGANAVRASIGMMFTNIKMLGIKTILPEEDNHLCKDFLKRIIPEHVKISYEETKFDTSGQLLAYIWLPIEFNKKETHILLNITLLANGYAMLEKNHNISLEYMDYFEQAEQFARENELGLWKNVDKKEETDATELDYLKNRKVVISYIYYGDDPEYIKLKNISDETINLSGWKIVSRIGNQEYRFKSLELKPGYVVTLYSGQSAEKNV